MTAIKPMLCRTELKPVNSPDIIWERKYDGIRLLALVDGSNVKLQARSGSNKTGLFPDLRIQTKLPAILDGEVISGNSFHNIQHRANRQNGIAQAAKEYPAVYHVFDILECAGSNLESVPLSQRKELLSKILMPTANMIEAEFFSDGLSLINMAKVEGWEGIIGKDTRMGYRQNKRDWIKVKIWVEGTFMVVGYTKGTGWREPYFGALVLGEFVHDEMYCVGEVGTGFNDGDITDLMRLFSPGTCPFSREPEPATWVKPFAIKVRYMERTNSGMLRFPSFKGVVK